MEMTFTDFYAFFYQHGQDIDMQRRIIAASAIKVQCSRKGGEKG